MHILDLILCVCVCVTAPAVAWYVFFMQSWDRNVGLGTFLHSMYVCTCQPVCVCVCVCVCVGPEGPCHPERSVR